MCIAARAALPLSSQLLRSSSLFMEHHGTREKMIIFDLFISHVLILATNFLIPKETLCLFDA
jgi:hypothetical protein